MPSISKTKGWFLGLGLISAVAIAAALPARAASTPGQGLAEAEETTTATATLEAGASPAAPSPTPTHTASPTPTASPTSYRVADVGVSLTGSRPELRLGERMRYEIETFNRGPATAPDGRVTATLSDARLRFTGPITLTGVVNGSCAVATPQLVRCSFLAILGTTIVIEAIADGPAGPDPVARLCAEIGFVSPGGGHDPDPSNNRACLATLLHPPTPTPAPPRWWAYLPRVGDSYEPLPIQLSLSDESPVSLPSISKR